MAPSNPAQRESAGSQDEHLAVGDETRRGTPTGRKINRPLGTDFPTYRYRLGRPRRQS